MNVVVVVVEHDPSCTCFRVRMLNRVIATETLVTTNQWVELSNSDLWRSVSAK